MDLLSRIKSLFTRGFKLPGYSFTSEPMDEKAWVILRVPFQSGEDCGTETECEAMYVLEREIAAAMPDSDVAVCDGDEIGNGVFDVVTFGRDADELERIIRRVIGERPMPKGTEIRKARGDDEEIVPLKPPPHDLDTTV